MHADKSNSRSLYICLKTHRLTENTRFLGGQHLKIPPIQLVCFSPAFHTCVYKPCVLLALHHRWNREALLLEKQFFFLSAGLVVTFCSSKAV